MKKTIKGSRYDTEKSELVATYSPYETDFDLLHWFVEELYRSPRGKWFLKGTGNALTRYGNGFDKRFGERIVRLKDEHVRQWLAETGNVELIEKYFNTVD